jgi:hypothetical protein
VRQAAPHYRQNPHPPTSGFEYAVRSLLFGLCVCFITAGPITKLFAWGGEESGGHVLRETTSRGLCGLVCPSRFGSVPTGRLVVFWKVTQNQPKLTSISNFLPLRTYFEDEAATSTPNAIQQLLLLFKIFITTPPLRHRQSVNIARLPVPKPPRSHAAIIPLSPLRDVTSG